MPELGQPPDNTHNMSFLCNATRFNVRCHICDVGTHPLSPAVWCPPGRLQGQKAAISGEICLFGPLLGPFSSDFRNPVPASGHVCDVADFGGLWRHPHGPRAHFREYTASVRIGSRAPGDATWRQPVRSRRRSARPASVRLPGIGNGSTRFRVAVRKRRSARPRARLRLARHRTGRPRRGRGPVVRRARY